MVSGFGGLPKEKRDTVKWMPPTLFVWGEKDEVVPVTEAKAMEKLAEDGQLPIVVKAYPVGHVFIKDDGKFDTIALFDAQRRMAEFFGKNLKQPEPARGNGRTK